MASDLESKKKADRTVPKNASAEILDQEIREGRTAIEASTVRLFLSGLSAGLDIGFSPFLVAGMAIIRRAFSF
jgi:formate-nitrite transporter family protein